MDFKGLIDAKKLFIAATAVVGVTGCSIRSERIVEVPQRTTVTTYQTHQTRMCPQVDRYGRQVVDAYNRPVVAPCYR